MEEEKTLRCSLSLDPLPPPHLLLLAQCLSLTCTLAESPLMSCYRPFWNLEVALSRFNGFAGVGFAPVDPPHLPVIPKL